MCRPDQNAGATVVCTIPPGRFEPIGAAGAGVRGVALRMNISGNIRFDAVVAHLPIRCKCVDARDPAKFISTRRKMSIDGGVPPSAYAGTGCSFPFTLESAAVGPLPVTRRLWHRVRQTRSLI